MFLKKTHVERSNKNCLIIFTLINSLNMKKTCSMQEGKKLVRRMKREGASKKNEKEGASKKTEKGRS